MNRRQAITTLAGALPGLTLAAESPFSRKKAGRGETPTTTGLFGAHWYYSWTPTSKSSPGVEFVPMIKTASNLAKAGAIKARKDTTHLWFQ